MKIVHVETVVARGVFAASQEWATIRDQLHAAVRAVDWPAGSGMFTIYPESGKKAGKGNGVKPIKNECIARLKALGWKDEEPFSVSEKLRPGDLDAVFRSTAGPVVMEWETGNVSSSHRALNKMSMGLMKSLMAAASLVIPSKMLAKYLTDRIGNYQEIEPYLDLWRSVPCENGVLEIVVIEHDAESLGVQKIPKGRDGNARRKTGRRSTSRSRKRRKSGG